MTSQYVAFQLKLLYLTTFQVQMVLQKSRLHQHNTAALSTGLNTLPKSG